jgi:ABC-type lipoprotein export system ATPase subunit
MSAAPATQPVIHAEGLTKVYSTGATKVHALRGVDVRVERGDMIAVMGSSGSGKSTLMNILGCLDSPTAGSYWLDGVRVEGLRRNALADIRNARSASCSRGSTSWRGRARWTTSSCRCCTTAPAVR